MLARGCPIADEYENVHVHEYGGRFDREANGLRSATG